MALAGEAQSAECCLQGCGVHVASGPGWLVLEVLVVDDDE